jgi:hypothetical protein
MLNELPWNAIDLHQSVRRWPVPPAGFLCRGMRPPRTKRPDRSPRRLQTRQSGGMLKKMTPTMKWLLHAAASKSTMFWMALSARW